MSRNSCSCSIPGRRKPDTIDYMRKTIYILLLVLLSVPQSALKAQVKVTAAIDSTEILIGEQTAVHIDVEHPNGQEPVFPKDIQPLMKEGVEVIATRPLSNEEDTPVKGLTRTRLSFVITSFEPALYYIPSMSVKVGKQTYSTNQLAIKVNDVKVDTAHVDKFFGPKEIIEPVYTWRDWMPLFLLALLLIACCVGVWISSRRLIATKAVKVVKKAKKEILLPHKQAQMEIEQLKNEYSTDDLTSKDYYTSLISILRRYVSKRYGFRADEMTSYELVEHLIILGDEQKAAASANPAEKAPLPGQTPDYSELREILSTADLTKFAKLKTDASEDKRNIMRLSSYIETTKSDTLPPATFEEEEAPEETPAKNPRTKKKIVLAAAIAVTAAVLTLIILEVFEMLL